MAELMSGLSTPSRKAWHGASPRGRREHRKHLTRHQLLAAGRKLFAEKGLYDSRIEDLSRHAGIAKGTLYGYFANKGELIEAVVSKGFGELLEHIRRGARGAGSRDEAVARISESHMEFFAQNPDLMRIFHQVRGLLKFNAVESRGLRKLLAKYLRGLAQILAHSPSTRPGRRSADLPVAYLLFGAISGVTSVRVSVKGALPVASVRRAIVRSLVGLVRAYETTGRPKVRPPYGPGCL
jgi:AcrR family transcriptional regulator